MSFGNRTFDWLKFGKIMIKRFFKLNTRNLSFLRLICPLRSTSLSLLKSIAIYSNLSCFSNYFMDIIRIFLQNIILNKIKERLPFASIQEHYSSMSAGMKNFENSRKMLAI